MHASGIMCAVTATDGDYGMEIRTKSGTYASNTTLHKWFWTYEVIIQY